jgi:hypothetical protein
MNRKGTPMEAIEVETKAVESQETALTAPQSNDLAPAMLQGRTPSEMVSEASEYAKALYDVIERMGLFTDIRGKKYVRVEGWTLLGSMMKVYPVTVWTRRIEASEGTAAGWEARVEARTISGAVVGAAEASCLYSEALWSKRDDYALRSMAQTRATAKSLRMPLGFIVALAGYEATPAEEMPRDDKAAGDSVAPQAKPDHPPAKQEKPAAPTKDEVLDSQKALIAMMKQLGESDESGFCRCGAVMVARLDGKGKPFGICQKAFDAYREALPEDKERIKAENRKNHDFKQLRKA